MKKSYLLGALGLLAMASCSQDETIGINHDGDEITFNVVTNSATRAENVYCNQNLPGGFYVSAISDGKTYIDKDYVTGANGKWTNTSGTRYWPETEVDFYAHVNGEASYKWSVDGAGKATAKFENFTVNNTVGSQEDLLYAVKTNQSKTNGTVNLNFRHALSQIVFQAKNTNENLYVKIAGVSVANVGGMNTFTFPSADTETNIEHNNYDTDGDGVYEDGEFGSDITYGTNWGTWAALTQGTEQYDADFSEIAVEGNNTLVALTTANDAGKEYNSNAMLLLPQKTTAWDPEANPVPDAAGNTGSYLLVDCAIFNVAGTSYADGDVCLWGKPQGSGWTTKELAIPVGFDWQQGKKYVYTLVFGNGNGGYDPDPEEPDPEDPKPVLVPISYQITVDDFDPISGGDIETGVPGE